MIDFLVKIWDILWSVLTFFPLLVWEIFNDTMREDKGKGKWSIKRLAGISGFYFAVTYAYIPIKYPEFEVKEFVFWGLITFAATAVGMTVWNKKIEKANLSNKED